MRLTNKDYVNILKYYNKPIPKSSSILKKQAESIMNLKLCRCIKKIDPVNEAKSIGICTKTIFNNKGFTRGEFKCYKNNNKSKIKFSKTNKSNKNTRKKKS